MLYQMVHSLVLIVISFFLPRILIEGAVVLGMALVEMYKNSKFYNKFLGFVIWLIAFDGIASTCSHLAKIIISYGNDIVFARYVYACVTLIAYIFWIAYGLTAQSRKS